MQPRTLSLIILAIIVGFVICPTRREDGLSVLVRYHTPSEIYSLVSVHLNLSIETNVYLLLNWLYKVTLFRPVKFIYLNGPSLKGWGGWNGLDWPDICSQLSQGVQASFWAAHPVECFNQIDKQVLATSIGITTLFLLIALYFLLHYAINMCMMRYMLRGVVVNKTLF